MCIKHLSHENVQADNIPRLLAGGTDVPLLQGHQLVKYKYQEPSEMRQITHKAYQYLYGLWVIEHQDERQLPDFQSAQVVQMFSKDAASTQAIFAVFDGSIVQLKASTPAGWRRPRAAAAA